MENEEHEKEEHSEIENKDVHEHKEADNSKSKLNVTDKMRENPWIASTIVLGIVLVIMIVGGFTNFTGGTITGGAIGVADAGANWIAYLEGMGYNAELTNVEEENGMYKVDFDYDGQESSVFLTLNGDYYSYGGLVPISAEKTSQTETSTEVPKSNKPVVELFVVSYCPYGIGAEKGFLPVMELLDDKADIQITFLHTQHGQKEEDENRLQVCLREEQKEQYLDYMKCFLGSGDSDSCLVSSDVDNSRLQSCLDSRVEGLLEKDLETTDKYGLRSSPTLIVNGVNAAINTLADRTPSNFLDIICSSFTNPPKECETKLSSEVQTPQFGYSTSESSGNTAAQCG